MPLMLLALPDSYCFIADASFSTDTDEAVKPSAKFLVQIENQRKIMYNWIAPEVLTGQHPSVSSDVYGLCAVLWETLKGT